MAITDNLPAFPRSIDPPVPLLAADGDPQPDDPPDDDEDVRAELEAARPRHPAAAVIPYQPRAGRARDTSLAAVSRALAATGGDPRLVRAALTNVTSADAAGVVRPQYMDELLGLLQLGTPLINVFRQGNITSNPIKFPTWTALPTVTNQATEKTAIGTGAVTIGETTITVKTYAGGNDASVQVLDWSSPSFLEAYFQAATEVYGRTIETAFETALLAAATSVGTGPFTSILSVIANMVGRLAGKGYPGQFVVAVSGDVFGMMFQALATGGPGIWGIVNGNFPTPPVVVAPFFPAGTILGAMTGAAITFQNTAAPIRLRAVDVNLLGVDLGVYGYFAQAALYPGALWKGTMTVPAPTLAGEGSFSDAVVADTGALDLSDLPAPAPAAKGK